MLQHARKSDYLTPSLVEAIIDHLVIRVKSRGDVIKRLVGLSVFHLQFRVWVSRKAISVSLVCNTLSG